MNSAEWRNYPKTALAVFPRVAECNGCHGLGLRINPHRVPYNRNAYIDGDGRYIPQQESTFYIECPDCGGTGRTIPPEWLAG